MSENYNTGTRAVLRALNVLYLWRRFLAFMMLIMVLVASGTVLLLPSWFRATATILPPKDQGMLNFLGSANNLLKGLTSLSRIGGMNQGGGTYNYFAILKSRALQETVVDEFDLMKVYDIDSGKKDDVLRELRDHVSFEYENDDYISIEVEDRDAERAAKMANFFVQQLNERSIALGASEARGIREFVGSRIDDVKHDLMTAEDSLRRYQERTGMLLSPDQMASISALSELYGTKAKKEIELGILRRTVSDDHEAVRQTEMELEEVSKKLGLLPEQGLQTFRLYREVVVHQKILEYLLPLLEQAKVNERRNVPVLVVLDTATPPERKARPQRALIILVITGLSFFIFVALVFVLENARGISEPSNRLTGLLAARSRTIAAKFKVG